MLLFNGAIASQCNTRASVKQFQLSELYALHSFKKEVKYIVVFYFVSFKVPYDFRFYAIKT